MTDLGWIPHLNASLNFTSLLCLLAGVYFIKNGREVAHRKAMMGACAASLVFLSFYLYYHYHVGHTTFSHPGLIRTVYLFVLAAHVSLAMTVPVFAILMVWWGLKDQRAKHKKLGHFAVPIWLYVSLSGLFVYFMLYHWYPAA